MMEDSDDALGGGFDRRDALGGGFERRDALGGGFERRDALGGGFERRDALGGGFERRDALGGGFERRDALGGGSKRRTALGGGLRMRYKGVPEERDKEGNTSDEEGSVILPSRQEGVRHATCKGRTNRSSRPVLRRRRYTTSSSETEGEPLSPPPREKRSSRKRRGTGDSRKRARIIYSSSESRNQSPSPKRKRPLENREEERDTKLVDKFLSILEKVKSSDKPKITFNSSVIPEFDPLSRNQTVSTWITKVEECAEVYGWEEREIIHYSLPKLSGVARTWYQGLTSILHTWSEWKRKLIESFPCREDYAELLTEMLSKKAKYGDSLEHYYYAKINLINRCKITGKQAVDCLLYSIEDRAVKVGAQAAQFREPEQVLKYFKTVKIGQSRDNQDTMRRRSENNVDCADSSKSGNTNPIIRCFNCNEIGHPSFKCEKTASSVKCHNCNEVGHRSYKCDKAPSKCMTCDRVGHLTSNCYKNIGKSVSNESENTSK